MLYGTQRALRRFMHQLPFILKRAHHATLSLLRPLAARNDLTPARFDLLYVLHRKGGSVEPYQFRIAQVLGLSRSTICKLVKAMEKAGLVERSREIIFDHRRRRVRLTRYGRRCVRRVLKAIRLREIDRPLLESVSFWKCNTGKERTDFIVDLIGRMRRVLIGLVGFANPETLYLYPTRVFRQRTKTPPPMRTPPSFRQQSLEWFLLKGFLETERAIS